MFKSTLRFSAPKVQLVSHASSQARAATTSTKHLDNFEKRGAGAYKFYKHICGPHHETYGLAADERKPIEDQKKLVEGLIINHFLNTLEAPKSIKEMIQNDPAVAFAIVDYERLMKSVQESKPMKLRLDKDSEDYIEDASKQFLG